MPTAFCTTHLHNHMLLATFSWIIDCEIQTSWPQILNFSKNGTINLWFWLDKDQRLQMNGWPDIAIPCVALLSSLPFRTLALTALCISPPSAPYHLLSKHQPSLYLLSPLGSPLSSFHSYPFPPSSRNTWSESEFSTKAGGWASEEGGIERLGSTGPCTGMRQTNAAALLWGGSYLPLCELPCSLEVSSQPFESQVRALSHRVKKKKERNGD